MFRFIGKRINVPIRENDFNLHPCYPLCQALQSIPPPYFDILNQLCNEWRGDRARRCLALTWYFRQQGLEMCLVRHSYSKWNSMESWWRLSCVSLDEALHHAFVAARRVLTALHHLFIIKGHQDRLRSATVNV